MYVYISAHAGYAPWDGINALDAAFVAYAGISALRQQIRPEQRVHGVISGRDWAPNGKFYTRTHSDTIRYVCSHSGLCESVVVRACGDEGSARAAA